jgi:hypothetical protein
MNLFYIIILFLIIWIVIKFNKSNNNIIEGGAFDFSKFLKSLPKKYNNKNENIEIEIKYKNYELFEKIVNWVRSNKKYTIKNTTNKIWNELNLIETTDEDNKKQWNYKKKLSQIDISMVPIKENSLLLGKITVALEKPADQFDIKGPPSIVRKKERISVDLNKYWRIDCTKVDTKWEIEFEYIADDYWNVLEHIEDIENFLSRL